MNFLRRILMFFDNLNGSFRWVVVIFVVLALAGSAAAGFLWVSGVSFQDLAEFRFEGDVSPAVNLDGDAVRAQNPDIPAESAVSGRPIPLLRINAVMDVAGSSTYRQRVEFLNGMSVHGLLTGENIDLATGTIIASNIIYGVSGGSGIVVSGGQNPVISQTFWTQTGDTIVTQDPGLNLGIGGGISAGGAVAIGSQDRSNLTLAGPAVIGFESYATSTIRGDVANALSIATSSGGSPILSFDTRAGGGITVASRFVVGTTTPVSDLPGVNPTSTQPLVSFFGFPDEFASYFEIKDASLSPVFIIDSLGRMALGTTTRNYALSLNGTSFFSDQATFGSTIIASSSAYFAVEGGRVGGLVGIT